MADTTQELYTTLAALMERPEDTFVERLKAAKGANRFTRIGNLAWCQTVFIQLIFCRKCRFMKPLLLSSAVLKPLMN